MILDKVCIRIWKKNGFWTKCVLEFGKKNDGFWTKCVLEFDEKKMGFGQSVY